MPFTILSLFACVFRSGLIKVDLSYSPGHLLSHGKVYAFCFGNGLHCWLHSHGKRCSLADVSQKASFPQSPGGSFVAAEKININPPPRSPPGLLMLSLSLVAVAGCDEGSGG